MTSFSLESSTSMHCVHIYMHWTIQRWIGAQCAWYNFVCVVISTRCPPPNSTPPPTIWTPIWRQPAIATLKRFVTCVVALRAGQSVSKNVHIVFHVFMCVYVSVCADCSVAVLYSGVSTHFGYVCVCVRWVKYCGLHSDSAESQIHTGQITHTHTRRGTSAEQQQQHWRAVVLRTPHKTRTQTDTLYTH